MKKKLPNGVVRIKMGHFIREEGSAAVTNNTVEQLQVRKNNLLAVLLGNDLEHQVQITAEPPERKIAIDLSDYVEGLKLTVIEAKELHLYISKKLNKHHYHGSLSDIDENDIMQKVCEKIINGQRKWNKHHYHTALSFFESCASSIIHGEGKAKRNREQQLTSCLTEREESDNSHLTPEDLLVSEESKNQILDLVTEKKPKLLRLAKYLILYEEDRTQALAVLLNKTEREVNNDKRALKRLIATYGRDFE